MDARNIISAHALLSEGNELYLRYIDGEYSCTITKQDTVIPGWGNDIHIQTQENWVDCDKICFMKTRKVEK